MPRFAFAIVAACALSVPAFAAEWPVCHGGNRAARHERGIEARDELRQLLSRNDAHIRDLGINDRYRRSLAMITVGDTTAGRILISKGLAERKDYRDTRNWCHRL